METVENRGKPHVSGFGASSADCGKLWRDFGKVFWGKVIHRKMLDFTEKVTYTRNCPRYPHKMECLYGVDRT